MAILKNTNFFKAFTASSTILAIYIQQFWDTMRPRHPVLQILWGIVHCSNIGYAERIWKEFVQSIQFFFTDKKRLTIPSQRKKKITPLLITSIRFTKLIIHHLKTKHNIHLRTGLPLHYSHEDNVLGNLKFVGKDGREVFGMPIPDSLLTEAIIGASDYGGYWLMSLIPEKKRKLVKETPFEPSPAKRSKAGLVGKRRIELSSKDLEARNKGPTRPMVFREPDSGRFQPLPDIQGKGKKKFIKEQVARDLLTLQTPKKKSPVDQYIFLRRNPTTTRPSGNVESPSLDAELRDSETESDKTVTPLNKEKVASNRELTEINAGVQDEGQAGSNTAVSDASTQQNPKQIDKEFTTTAYPNVQENLKLPTKEHVILEEPDTSSVPLMTTPVLDLTTSQSDFPTINASLLTSTSTTITITTTTTLPSPLPQPQQSTIDLILLQRIGKLEQHMVNLIQDKLALEERLDKHRSRLYNLENLNSPQKVSKAVDEIVTDVVDWAMQALLRARFSDLPAVDIKEILQQRMFEDHSYQAHDDHKNLFEALQKTPSGSPPPHPPPPPPPAGAFGALGTLGASGSSQLPLPPPPPSTDTNQSNQEKGSGAPSSSKSAASTSQSMAWTTSDTRYESTGFAATHETSPTDYLMNDDSIPDKQATVLASTYVPPAKNSLLAKTGDMTTFMNWYCQKMEECHKILTDQITWVNSKSDQVRIDVSRPLPLGGPPGKQASTFNSKMKAARYPDFGLDLLKFYIDRHDSPSHQREVRIKAFSRYGYDYLSEIVLRSANFQEHTIAEKDFKNLYPSEFEDLNLLLLQGHLDHLPGFDKLVFPINNNERKIMRFNKMYKFSDGDFDVYTLEDPTLILEILSRRFFLRLNLPDHSIKDKGTSRTMNNQAFTIKKSMSMPVQLSQVQDGERPQIDYQILDLAGDLKEAQVHISSTITSHKTMITTSKLGPYELKMLDDSGDPNATPLVPTSKRLQTKSDLSAEEKAYVDTNNKDDGVVMEDESEKKKQLDEVMGNDDGFDEGDIPQENASKEFLDEFKLMGLREMPTIADYQ
uniref:Uncharacterized protein n=1 Tax=Tanacetum cinerariifolium TaxID=118510 RepID=A0A6L2JG09_TANCI|nr:hypothetical protein [Tanacetum cinerariifolium]